MLRKELLAAVRATLVTLLAVGLVYPLATTAVATLLFPHRAGGSLIADASGNTIGSELIAQPFGRPVVPEVYTMVASVAGVTARRR